ncbi:hypothetical protein PQQ65_32190 [Paraburkholderia strydomiana]|uniref:hypothetical protein n=1 Tax=Paraburkholderia strydomiana TaxID=1245417 RepID=UPI0038BD8821
MDRTDELCPENYRSAQEAIRAIERISVLRKRFNLYEDESPLNDRAAALAIVEGAETLPLDGPFLAYLDALTEYVDDDDARESIRAMLRLRADENWDTFVESLRERSLKLFAEHGCSADDKFREFMTRWNRLRSDAALRDQLVEAMRGSGLSPATAIARLRLLEGDCTAAQRVLAAVMAQKSGSSKRGPFDWRDEYSALIGEWATDTVWGQLEYLLWSDTVGEEVVTKLPDSLSMRVTYVAALLKEFGILADDSDYQLEELSPETRASWRRELKSVIGYDAELRNAAAEALLWFGDKWRDRAVLFAVLELYDAEGEQPLQRFLEHSDPLVHRRTRAIIDMMRVEPDAMELQIARQKERLCASISTEPVESPKTWIGDVRTERLIRMTLDEAASGAASAIGKSLDSGEETHVMLLFERLRAAFSGISERLALLATEAGANEHLSLRLDYRIVGKHEEGGPGIGTKTFSADICLLIDVREKGVRFARRASLIQAKRLYRGRGHAADYYPLKTVQLEDLAGQTLASFLLLLGPTCEGVTIPVIPARLMLDLVKRGDSASQIAPAKAAGLGKGIGTWLVDDVIGLWTGDCESEIIERAEGGMDREPFLLVELVADRVQLGRDG